MNSEAERLEALYRYEILDTLPEQVYNDIVLLAAEICGAPMALITLVDETRQWFKAKIGLNRDQTPREYSFCAHAIKKPDEITIVRDARQDSRFSGNPYVTGAPGIRFYAGAPLVTPEGQALGTLCVLDVTPRDLTPRQQESLRALARQVMAQLELRFLNIINKRNSAEAQQAMMAARMLAEQVQDLYNNAPCGYHSLDKDGKIVLINDTELKWLGYSREELLGKCFTQVLPPRDWEDFLKHFAEVKELRTLFNREIELQRKDGTAFPVLLNVSILRDEEGNFLLTRSTVMDISEARAATAALRDSEERFQAFMENGPGVAFIKDEAGRYLYVNRQFLERFHKSHDEIVGRYDHEVWPDEVARMVRRRDAAVLAGHEVVMGEETSPTLDGRLMHWLSFKFPLQTLSGETHLGGIAIDITERKYYEEQLQEYQRQLEDAVARLEEMATTDALTQVKNHGAFVARLEEEVARAHRYRQPLSLLMLDADEFKRYNDEFGHPAGDGVLRNIAECLKSCARPSDFVARYGGEEFAVILANTAAAGALSFAERMRQVVAEAPCPHRAVTISVGAASLNQSVTTSTQLLAAADKALYAAKRAGRNCVRQAPL